jgi:hypothetical protein
MSNGETNANFTQTQRETLEKINNLLDNSTANLLCGPDCQHNNYVRELKQKYETALANNMSAPHDLKEAKKNYLIASDGDESYRKMLEKELKQKATEICERLTINFNKEIEGVMNLKKRYNTELVSENNTRELNDYYQKENKHLINVLDTTTGEITTNERKTYYEQVDLERVQNIYKWLLFFYYLCVISVVIWMFKTQSRDSWVKNSLIIVMCMLYPFFIDWFRHLLMFIFKIIYKFIFV